MLRALLLLLLLFDDAFASANIFESNKQTHFKQRKRNNDTKCHYYILSHDFRHVGFVEQPRRRALAENENRNTQKNTNSTRTRKRRFSSSDNEQHNEHTSMLRCYCIASRYEPVVGAAAQSEAADVAREAERSELRQHLLVAAHANHTTYRVTGRVRLTMDGGV
jgi:hypothetical protein